MTIVLDDLNYSPKDFLFTKVNIKEENDSAGLASAFLTLWISGKREFEFNTSGTTNTPKIILLKRKWMEISALQTINRLKLWNENILCCLPTHKVGGIMMFVRALAGDFDITLFEPRADPMLDLNADHSFTFVSLVPYQLSAIFKSDESTQKLNRFRTVLVGGSEINDVLVTQLEALNPTIYHTYGMTETCSHIALKKLNHGAWPHFIPNEAVELKTDDEGVLAMSGYQTGLEWVQSSDMARIYKDGSFDILGRADFVINSGGFKIIPEQLEKTIADIFNSNNLKTSLAITSKPHSEWGEELILILSGTTFPAKDKIFELLKPRLKAYEVPKQIIFMDEIPLNDGGKTDRRRLKMMNYK